MKSTKLIVCPDNDVVLPKSIFLAGGISNCPNWQNLAIKELARMCSSLQVINPRRDDFDITDEHESVMQIAWENQYLTLADSILFWFPKDTLCPITLFELGKWAGKKKLFVGVDPDYKRSLDVVHQLKLIDPSIDVCYNLFNLLDEVIYHYKGK